MDQDRKDLFISYTGPDRPWAEWAAWHLEQAGYQLELDVWDWAAGDNASLRMNDALARADRVLALFSRAYFARDRYTTDEWTAVMADRPDADGGRRLVPVRVEQVTPPPILRPAVYRDVFDLPEAQAVAELLAAVQGPARPSHKPPLPGGAAPPLPGGAGPPLLGGAGPASPGPRAPGTLPPVCHLPPRNPAFTGRQALLAALRQRLASGNGRAWVQALHGQGGVGKTQLAIEYGHLFAGDYQLITAGFASTSVLPVCGFMRRHGPRPGRTSQWSHGSVLLWLCAPMALWPRGRLAFRRGWSSRSRSGPGLWAAVWQAAGSAHAHLAGV